LAQTRDRYLRAKDRKSKGQLLAEAVSVTGYHRKAIIRAWRRPEPADRPHRRRGAARRYGPAVVRALKAYCQTRGIQFTRGRPYKKDDNAHVEQKNWTHVRKHMGYVRYDTEVAVAAMNEVYADLRLLQNLFLPSVKLQAKERVGARLRRRYGPPCTPLDRVRACPQADRAQVAALVALRHRLDPFALAARIDRKLEHVYALASVRRGRPIKTASRAA
jgi:hypothetical protein